MGTGTGHQYQKMEQKKKQEVYKQQIMLYSRNGESVSDNSCCGLSLFSRFCSKRAGMRHVLMCQWGALFCFRLDLSTNR